MNSLRDGALTGTKLGEEERGALEELLSALRGLPHGSVKSAILYGSATSEAYRPGRSDVNLLILVDRIDLSALKELVEPVARGRKGSLAPFFLTEEDVRATVDIFPLKYMAMKNRYRLLYGIDFLADLEVKTDYALLRIRQRLMNMLLRMRRHYLVNNGQQLTAIMAQQAKRFFETLEILLSARGGNYGSEKNIIEAFAHQFGLSPEMLRELHGLRDAETALGKEQEEGLYARFLDALHRVSEGLIVPKEERGQAPAPDKD